MPEQYKIQSGDTLTKIAKQYGTTVDALAKTNNISNPDLIYAGNSLTIPGAEAPQSPTGNAIEKKADVGVITSKDAISEINDSKSFIDQKYPNQQSAQVQQQPAQPTTQPTAQPDTGVEKKAYFTNQIGQELELTEKQLNDPKNKDFLEKNGYIMAKSDFPVDGDFGVSATQQEYNQINDQIESIARDFLSYNVDQDPDFAAQAQMIRAQFDKMREEMKKINYQRERSYQTLGLRSGATQYGGEIQTGLEGEEIKQGNERIAEISRQEAQAISAARAAFESGKYEKFSKTVGTLKDLREQKAEELAGFNKALVDFNNRIQQEKESLIQQEKFQMDKQKFQLDIKESLRKEQQSIATNIAPVLISLDENFDVQEASSEQVKQIADQYGIDPVFLYGEMQKQAKELRAESRVERGSFFDRQKFAYQQAQDAVQQAITERKLSMEEEIFGYTLDIKRAEAQLKQKEVEDSLKEAFSDNSGNISIDAVNNALGNLKMTKDQKDIVNAQVQRQLVQGDYLGVKETLITAARNSASATQADASIGRAQAIDALNTIQKGLDDLSKEGVATGAIKGNYEANLNKLGKGDPKIADITSKITLAIQTYRKAVSGAAFTESEGKEYGKVFPSTGKGKELNDALIESLKNTFESSEESFLKTQLGPRTWDVIKDIGNTTSTYQPISSFEDLYARGNQDLIDLFNQYDNDPNFNGLSTEDIIDAVNQTMGFKGETGGLFTTMVENKYPDNSVGGQCGTWAHKIVNFPYIGDLKDEKFASVRKYGILKDKWIKEGPKVGDVIITGESSKWGHVAIVNQVLPNGKIKLSESNFNGDERVQHDRIIDVNAPIIYGAIRGTYKV